MSHETASPNSASQEGLLLALSTGLRETGWAVFQGAAVAASGVVGLKTSRKTDPSVRICRQLEGLTAVLSRWQAPCAARSKPSGVNLRAPGLDLLDASLRQWADGLDISLFDYTTQEVRAAVAGLPNASKDAQCYAIMRKLGLIGQSRSTPEWEAIAVGHYHRTLSELRFV